MQVISVVLILLIWIDVLLPLSPPAQKRAGGKGSFFPLPLGGTGLPPVLIFSPRGRPRPCLVDAHDFSQEGYQKVSCAPQYSPAIVPVHSNSPAPFPEERSTYWNR